jgi:SanA protein
MLKHLMKFLRRLLLSLAALGLLALVLPRLFTTIYSWPRIHTVDNAPSERVVIVFGAGLTRGGYPTAVLRDRVETATRLYFAGKVQKLLMSGDNRTLNYNEPGAMREYALSLGVPSDAIVLDYAGRSTYDTCYRAKVIFGLNTALLVTQQFHLPRALFLCNLRGIQASGVVANNIRYSPLLLLIWNIREQLATIGAFIDVYVSKPVPVLGNPEPIFPEAS